MAIFYLGVFRFSDKVCVAGYANKNSDANITDKPIIEILSNDEIYLQPGRNYTEEGEIYSISYVADDENRVFAVVTERSYPARVTFTLLEELRDNFMQDFAEKSLTAKKHSLSGKTKPILKALLNKYDDLQSVDKISYLNDQIDVVKTQMQENIRLHLENYSNLEGISRDVEDLTGQAKMFEGRSHQLRRKMRCKNLKLNLLIAGIVIIILIVIIVPIVLRFHNSDDGDDDNKGESNDNRKMQVVESTSSSIINSLTSQYNVWINKTGTNRLRR